MHLIVKKNDIINFIELVVMFYILHFSGSIKYIFFVAWISYYLVIYRSIKKEMLYILLPSLICIGIGLSLAVFNSLNTIAIKESIFYFLPPFGAICIWKAKGYKTKNYVDVMFFADLTVFLITMLPKFNKVDWLESQYAFIIGIYVLYFLFNHEYKMFFVSLVALILAHKRIAWGGVLIAAILLFVTYRKRKESSIRDKKKAIYVVTIVGVLAVAILLVWVYLCSIDAVSMVMMKFHINSQGRIDQWVKFNNQYVFSPFYVGHGLGYVTSIIERWGISTYLVFHNDILLMYIQLGFIGFVAYFYSHFMIVKHYIKHYSLQIQEAMFLITIIGYTFICYLTDNISIYINYQFPFYVIFFSIIYEKILNDKNINN